MHELFCNMTFSSEEDTLIWRRSTKGDFSIAEFCSIHNPLAERRDFFKFIWRPWIPVKISVLCWRIFYNALSIDDNLRICGIQLASKFCCCPSPAEELIAHIFFQGHSARIVWAFLSRVFSLPPLTSMYSLTNTWLRSSTKASFFTNLRSMLATCTLWELWLQRNHAKLASTQRNCIKSIKDWASNLLFLVKGSFKNNLCSLASFHLLEISPLPCAPKGSWKVWLPWLDGLTLTLDIASKNQQNFVAGFIWSKRKEFILALKWPIRESCIFTGILEMITLIRDLSLEVMCFQGSSEHFDCLTNPSLAPPRILRESWRLVLAWSNIDGRHCTRQELNL